MRTIPRNSPILDVTAGTSWSLSMQEFAQTHREEWRRQVTAQAFPQADLALNGPQMWTSIGSYSGAKKPRPWM